MEHAPSQPQPSPEIDDEIPASTRAQFGELAPESAEAENSGAVDGDIDTLDSSLTAEERRDAIDEETRRTQELEASHVLKGSQRFDKTFLEFADRGMQKVEAFSATVGDKVFEQKDRRNQARVDGREKQYKKYDRLSKTAPTEFLRKRYAKKARQAHERLENATEWRNMDRKSHDAKLDKTEPNKATGELEVVKPGERSTRRNERIKELQERIHKLIAAEYRYAKQGREARNEHREIIKGVGDPYTREMLRRQLLDSTSSVEKLEKVGSPTGRKAFVDKMAAAYGTSGMFSAVTNSINRLSADIQIGRQATQGEHDLVA